MEPAPAETYSVIQLYNMDERNRRNFTCKETIFLVILRIL